MTDTALDPSNEDSRFLLARKLLGTFDVATAQEPDGRWRGTVKGIPEASAIAYSEVDAHVAAHVLAFHEIGRELESHLQDGDMAEAPVAHRGLGHYRVKLHPQERAFAEAWEKENTSHLTDLDTRDVLRVTGLCKRRSKRTEAYESPPNECPFRSNHD